MKIVFDSTIRAIKQFIAHNGILRWRKLNLMLKLLDPMNQLRKD